MRGEVITDVCQGRACHQSIGDPSMLLPEDGFNCTGRFHPVCYICLRTLCALCREGSCPLLSLLPDDVLGHVLTLVGDGQRQYALTQILRYWDRIRAKPRPSPA